MKVTILRGLPGSGKSTLIAKEFPDATVVSADHYFVDEAGVYRFDPARLKDAHGACLREFIHHVRGGNPRTIVVDNTNVCAWEMAPYAATAQAYGYEFEIVTIECDVETALKRNVHGVPEETIRRMADRLKTEELPPFWPHRRV